MKKLVLTVSAGFCLLGFSAFAESYTGYISDANCGAKHNDGSAKAVACVEKCVKGGAGTVMVVGDKVYKISDPAKVADQLGKKVTINGSVADGTMTVQSVAAEK